MHFFGRACFAAVLVALATLSGCASTKVSMSQEEYVSVLGESNKKVDELLQSGKNDDAIKVLDGLSSRNPGRKEPWQRKAKIYFDAGNYAQAIVAAEEVLQRDDADRTARSIRAVAGLRVAAQSLTALRSDVELKGDARSDAVGLAAVMRETLGAEVLVPQSELDEKKRKEQEAEAARARARAKAQAQAQAQKRAAISASAAGTSAQAAPSGGSGNPFGALQ